MDMGLIQWLTKLLSGKNNMSKTNLILFGPPGSGKGTQAAKLVEKYNLLHISTGDLFRYEIGNKTPLGLKAKAFIDAGDLVPDEVTIGMLKNKVNANPDVKGYIFDGFPRTTPQAEALDAFLAESNQEVSKLIALDVQDEEIVKRLLERGKTSNRPDDQDENIIRNRIAVYQKETAVVYGHYDKSQKAETLNGLGSIEEIFGRLSTAIDSI
jgi:adenylate kinase